MQENGKEKLKIETGFSWCSIVGFQELEVFTKLLLSTFLFSWGFLATKQSEFIDRSWCVVFLKFDLLEATLLVAENAFGIGTLLSLLLVTPSLCMLTSSLEASYINYSQILFY